MSDLLSRSNIKPSADSIRSGSSAVLPALDVSALKVQELRKRWKPHKARLEAQDSEHPTNIRLHRAFSWLEQAEQLNADQDSDLTLVTAWIALNALYGQWDEVKREPRPDRECWRKFYDQVLKIDGAGHFQSLLTGQRAAVMTILNDEYLCDYFWEDPSDLRANQSKSTRLKAPTWYLEKRWGLILERVLERIYLLRCQLVHGASTFASKLNRTALQRCNDFFLRLLITTLTVVVENGADEDWGPMCYPPIKQDV